MSDSLKRFRRIEKATIVFCLIIFIMGIVEEIIAYLGIHIITIEEFRNFSLVLLQIQAGVSTIAVALIALISGMINEEVCGIGITRYYMMLRPRFFKQLVVVILTVSLVFVGTIFNMLQLYNMVCACFFLEWILIILSVIEIFPVVYGKKKCEKEILDYVEAALISSDVTDKMEMNRTFLAFWMSDMEQNDFEQREKLLLLGIENMLIENTEEAIIFINDNVGELVRTHLMHNKHWINGRGLLLLRSIYERMWMLILNKKLDPTKTKAFPNIIQNLFYDVRDVLMHLEIKEIEDYFDCQSLLEYAARVTVHYLQPDEKRCEVELSTLEMYASFFGFLLGLKKNESQRELDEADVSYWSGMLDSIFILGSNIPEEMLPIYKLHRCKVYFSYIAGLIQDGHAELVIKRFYGSGHYIFEDDVYVLLLRFCVQCYMYYLAFAESDSIVPEKVRKSAQYILNQREDVVLPFDNLLDRLYYSHRKSFSEYDFEKLMCKVLDRYELYNMGHVKQIIMPDVIRKWYVTLLLLLYDKGILDGSIGDYLSGDILAYVHMFLGDGSDNIVDEIVKIYEFLRYKPVDDVEAKKSELYGTLKNVLLEKYKATDIKESYEAHKKFIDDDRESIISEAEKKAILGRLNSTFAPVIDDSIENAKEMNFLLIELHNETKFLYEKSTLQVMGIVEGNFCEYLINVLNNSGKVEMYNRKDKSDQDYIAYLKDKDIGILMGSEFDLKQKDYRNRKLYDDFEQTCDCIYTAGRKAIALVKDKLKISIRDVDVAIRSGDLSETNICFDKASGKYRIQFFDKVEGLFDEQEAKEYAKNKFKVISATVKVAIQAEDGAGVIIKNQ